uniref:Uncharacterized protein n=1 Tax=Rhizophora mucronata TaxID=61149 RepID=A0A2P2MPB5_RHIMU
MSSFLIVCRFPIYRMGYRCQASNQLYHTSRFPVFLSLLPGEWWLMRFLFSSFFGLSFSHLTSLLLLFLTTVL